MKLKQSDLRIGDLVVLNSNYDVTTSPFVGIVVEKDAIHYNWVYVLWIARNKQTPARIDTISRL
jgi:hypothetical protein